MDRRQVLGALAIGVASIREYFTGSFGASRNPEAGLDNVIHLRPGEKYKLPRHPVDGLTLTFLAPESISAQSLIVPEDDQTIMGEKGPLEIDAQAHFNLRYEKITRCWMFYTS